MFEIATIRHLLLFLLILLPERRVITFSSRVSNCDDSIEETRTLEHSACARDQCSDGPEQAMESRDLVLDSRHLLLDHGTSTTLYKDNYPGKHGLCAANLQGNQAPQLLPRAIIYSQEEFERDRSRRL